MSEIQDDESKRAGKPPNTEAFRRFHDFKDEFDKNIQFSHGLLELMKTGSLATDGFVTLPTGSEPWGKQLRFRSYEKYATDTSSFIATMGIVRAFAAFEDFLTVTVADLERTKFLRQDTTETTRSDDTLPLDRQLGIIKFPISEISSELPIYEFFSLSRNCIVHRNGRATDDLSSCASSAVFLKAYSDWKIGRGKPKPALPDIVPQKHISWSPRHAILCRIVLYKIAEKINGFAITKLNESGLIYLAAYYTLFAKGRVRIKAYKSADKMIRSILADRYRVSFSQRKIINTLQTAGKWKDCLKEHRKLFGP